MRLAQGVDGVAVEIGDGLAHHLVGGAAVELHVAGESHGVGAGLLQWLADVERLDAGEVVDALEHEAADAGKDAAALGRGRPAPDAIEGGAGGGHGGVDIGGLPARNAGNGGAIRGVLDIEVVAAEGGDPAAADEAFRGIEEEIGIGTDVHGICVRR